MNYRKPYRAHVVTEHREQAEAKLFKHRENAERWGRELLKLHGRGIFMLFDRRTNEELLCERL